MVKKALGLIETVGFTAAIEAADAAVKAANIELLGYELTKGGGMVVIKLGGDVGAVKAAVEAGAQAAGKVGKVWATHVIPRPHDELAGIVTSQETVGPDLHTEPPADPAADQAETVIPGEKKSANTCNLCGDPACPRKKGEPRATCLHNSENSGEDE